MVPCGIPRIGGLRDSLGIRGNRLRLDDCNFPIHCAGSSDTADIVSDSTALLFWVVTPALPISNMAGADAVAYASGNFGMNGAPN